MMIRAIKPLKNLYDTIGSRTGVLAGFAQQGTHLINGRDSTSIGTFAKSSVMLRGFSGHHAS